MSEEGEDASHKVTPNEREDFKNNKIIKAWNQPPSLWARKAKIDFTNSSGYQRRNVFEKVDEIRGKIRAHRGKGRAASSSSSLPRPCASSSPACVSLLGEEVVHQVWLHVSSQFRDVFKETPHLILAEDHDSFFFLLVNLLIAGVKTILFKTG